MGRPGGRRHRGSTRRALSQLRRRPPRCGRPMAGMTPRSRVTPGTTPWCRGRRAGLGCAMSSTISLVIGAVGLLAAVFALIVVLRRPPARDQPAVAAAPAAEPAGVESASVTAAVQRTLEEAGQEADQVRARAQADAVAIVREAGLASDKAAQAS